MFSLGDTMVGLTVAVVVLLTIFLLGYVVSTMIGEWRDQRRARRTRTQLRQLAWRANVASRPRTGSIELTMHPAAALDAAGSPSAVGDPRPVGRRRSSRPEYQLPARANLPHTP